MLSDIVLILCVFCIIVSVQARSIDKIESGKEIEMSKETKDDELYSKLLAYLQTHNFPNDKDSSASSSSSSSSSEENTKLLPKRGFFLFPNRRSNQQRFRQTHTYGRKSHWDTFFG